VAVGADHHSLVKTVVDDLHHTVTDGTRRRSVMRIRRDHDLKEPLSLRGDRPDSTHDDRMVVTIRNGVKQARQGMDLRTYFQLFWVPAIASAVLMALLWIQRGLSGRAALFLTSWFVLALAAQYAGTTAGVVWAVGLAAQTALAVFLLLKHQL